MHLRIFTTEVKSTVYNELEIGIREFLKIQYFDAACDIMGPGDPLFECLYKVVSAFEAARPKTDIIGLQM